MERMKAPKFDWSKMDLQEVLKDMRDAYACARVVLYSQAFAMLFHASQKHQWEIDCSQVARVFSGGNILRSKLLVKYVQPRIIG